LSDPGAAAAGLLDISAIVRLKEWRPLKGLP